MTRTSAPAARGAVEGVLEAKDLDAELIRRVLIEDAVGGVRVVVAAHAGVVAPDDEMGAAVVAPDDRVEDCLLRTGVTHPCGVGREQDAVGWKVPRQKLLVTAHPHR